MKIITFSVLTLYSKASIGYDSQSIILGPVTSKLPDNYQKWKFYAHPFWVRNSGTVAQQVVL